MNDMSILFYVFWGESVSIFLKITCYSPSSYACYLSKKWCARRREGLCSWWLLLNQPPLSLSCQVEWQSILQKWLFWSIGKGKWWELSQAPSLNVTKKTQLILFSNPPLDFWRCYSLTVTLVKFPNPPLYVYWENEHWAQRVEVKFRWRITWTVFRTAAHDAYKAQQTYNWECLTLSFKM